MGLEKQMKSLNAVSNGKVQDENKIQLYDEALERFALGSILRGSIKFFDLANYISDEDFYLIQHKQLFNICRDLSNTDNEINVLNIDHTLKQQNSRSGITLNFLTNLFKEELDKIYSPEELSKLLKAFTKKRITKQAAENAIHEIEKGASVSDVVGTMNQQLIRLEDKPKTLYNFNENWNLIGERIEARFNNKTILSLDSGMSELNQKVKFRKSNLVVIGAKTGTGKTTFCLNLAHHMAIDNKKVLFISTEMNSEEIDDKIIAIGGGVELVDLSSGMIDPKGEKMKDVGKVLMQYEDKNLFIDTSPYQTFEMIKNRAKQLINSTGLDVIFVDYIQRLKLPGKQSRYDEVTNLSNIFKDLAQELNVCIFLISQFSRDGIRQNTKNQIPTINSFKESGSIENDANVALLLYRESEDDKVKAKNSANIDKNKIKIIIAKNRMGPTGDFDMYVHPATNRMWCAIDHLDWTRRYIDCIDVDSDELTI